jgi:hypothetical protein
MQLGAAKYDIVENLYPEDMSCKHMDCVDA